MSNDSSSGTLLHKVARPAFNADDTLVSIDRPAQRYIAAAVSVLGLAVYAGYLVYRAAFTLNRDALVFSLLVYFAEVHGFVSLFLYFHQLSSTLGS